MISSKTFSKGLFSSYYCFLFFSQELFFFSYILHSEELEISTTAHMQSNISTVKTPGNKMRHLKIFKSLRKKIDLNWAAANLSGRKETLRRCTK